MKNRMVHPAQFKYMYAFVSANFLLTLVIWALVARFQWTPVVLAAAGYALACFLFIPWCRNVKLYYLMGVVGTLFQSTLVMLSIAPQVSAVILGIGLLLVAWALLAIYQLRILRGNQGHLIAGGMLNVKRGLWDLSRPVALDYSQHGGAFWPLLFAVVAALVPYASAIGYWLHQHPSAQITLTTQVATGAAFLAVQTYAGSLHTAHILFFSTVERTNDIKIRLPGRKNGLQIEKSLWLSIAAFILLMVFAAPSFLAFPKESIGMSPSFLVLALGIAAFAALRGTSRALQMKTARLGIVVVLLLNAIRLLSITLFPDILTSTLAVSGSALLIVGLHALLPRLAIRMWAEQVAPSTYRGKRLAWMGRAVLPGLLLMGASLGRSFARQNPDIALLVMGSLSFLCAMLFMHMAISDDLYKADVAKNA